MPFRAAGGGVEEEEEDDWDGGVGVVALLILLLLLLLSELGLPLAALRISSRRKRWTEPEAVSMSPGSDRTKLLVVPLWKMVIVSVSRADVEVDEAEEEEEPLRSSAAAAAASVACRACSLL